MVLAANKYFTHPCCTLILLDMEKEELLGSYKEWDETVVKYDFRIIQMPTLLSVFLRLSVHLGADLTYLIF